MQEFRRISALLCIQSLSWYQKTMSPLLPPVPPPAALPNTATPEGTRADDPGGHEDGAHGVRPCRRHGRPRPLRRGWTSGWRHCPHHPQILKPRTPLRERRRDNRARASTIALLQEEVLGTCERANERAGGRADAICSVVLAFRHTLIFCVNQMDEGGRGVLQLLDYVQVNRSARNGNGGGFNGTWRCCPDVICWLVYIDSSYIYSIMHSSG